MICGRIDGVAVRSWPAVERRSYRERMTEPPRPPGHGHPDDPSADPTAYVPPSDPTAHVPPPGPPGAAGPGYGQPGYGTPGYGGPPPGYGGPPPGYGGPPPGHGTTDEKTWAMLVHFGGIILGFIAPLIGLLAKGTQSPTVRAHSVEALNFQITWGIVLLATTVLGFCSFGLLAWLVFVPWLVIIVFSVIAGSKANDGVLYRYPATWRVVK